YSALNFCEKEGFDIPLLQSRWPRSAIATLSGLATLSMLIEKLENAGLIMTTGARIVLSPDGRRWMDARQRRYLCHECRGPTWPYIAQSTRCVSCGAVSYAILEAGTLGFENGVEIRIPDARITERDRRLWYLCVHKW